MIKPGFYNLDCMDGMAQFPDKFFELAIVDPPYGIGESGGVFRDRKGGGIRVHHKKRWDDFPAGQDYFKELRRVSAEQIIWGGNHFASHLPNSSGWVYWEKLMGGDFSDGELAWTSFDRALRQFTLCNKYKGQIHPTQKPIALYKWLLSNYAKPGDKILDTHVGSASSLIACHQMGFEYWGFELDADYYQAATERLNKAKAQVDIFEAADMPKPEQMTI